MIKMTAEQVLEQIKMGNTNVDLLNQEEYYKLIYLVDELNESETVKHHYYRLIGDAGLDGYSELDEAQEIAIYDMLSSAKKMVLADEVLATYYSIEQHDVEFVMTEEEYKKLEEYEPKENNYGFERISKAVKVPAYIIKLERV